MVLPAKATRDPALRLDRQDTQLHYGVSLVGTYGLTEFFKWRAMPKWKALAWAGGLVFAAGLVKETLMDDFFSENDLVADSLGIVSAAMLQITIRF